MTGPSERNRALAKAGLGIALLVLAVLPFLLWVRQPSRELRVVVVDKTVPDATLREHASLFWLLGHRKYRKPSGQAYDPARDYYGFFPLPGHRWEAREPGIAAARPELIYLADTYGVYTEEFYGQPQGNRSTGIYTGFRGEEVDDLAQALGGCRTLVGEFNTFASPTTGDPRARLEAIFGLAWDGWTGRFFKDLERSGEVPPWAVRNYERQTGREWAFEGPGFLLCNEDDRVEVLEEGVDVEAGRGLRICSRPEGARRLDLPGDARYDYWFDFVAPRPGTEVLADYRIPLLAPGARKLQAMGLPAQTPAVLSGLRGSTRTYYFAGDFVDAGPAPDLMRAAGFAAFRRAVIRESPGDPQAFFWRVYVPMMSRILEDAWRRSPGGSGAHRPD